MINSSVAEAYFIAAMMILILILSAAAMFFFRRQYKKEKRAKPLTREDVEQVREQINKKTGYVEK